MLVDLWLLLKLNISPETPTLNAVVTLVASTLYWAGVAAGLTFIVSRII